MKLISYNTLAAKYYPRKHLMDSMPFDNRDNFRSLKSAKKHLRTQFKKGATHGSIQIDYAIK